MYKSGTEKMHNDCSCPCIVFVVAFLNSNIKPNPTKCSGQGIRFHGSSLYHLKFSSTCGTYINI